MMLTGVWVRHWIKFTASITLSVDDYKYISADFEYSSKTLPFNWLHKTHNLRLQSACKRRKSTWWLGRVWRALFARSQLAIRTVSVTCGVFWCMRAPVYVCILMQIGNMKWIKRIHAKMQGVLATHVYCAQLEVLMNCVRIRGYAHTMCARRNSRASSYRQDVDPPLHSHSSPMPTTISPQIWRMQEKCRMHFCRWTSVYVYMWYIKWELN